MTVSEFFLQERLGLLMEYVLTSAEMKASDKAAIETYGISSLVLMERAALQTVKVIIERFGAEVYVGVMTGSGNKTAMGIKSPLDHPQKKKRGRKPKKKDGDFNE